MLTIDLHGYLVEEAIDYIENVIGKIRLENREDIIKVITGHGKIQRELMFYLLKNKIEHQFEIGNKGAVLIIID